MKSKQKKFHLGTIKTSRIIYRNDRLVFYQYGNVCKSVGVAELFAIPCQKI